MTSLATRMREIELKLNFFDEMDERGEFNSEMYEEYDLLRGELIAYKKIMASFMNLELIDVGVELL